ncbi:MAG TPA: DNA methyltransferase, partial [bacterium]|nr:DNA methyltransferase [bacterium]
LPRLHGFEILMASYTMCHLKLEMLLKETGYKPKNQQRLQVYLTNSLEEPNPYTGTIFASWLSQEAAEANYIKRESPVMVVLGNPPYAVSSTNKNEWIQGLIADYKKDLNERKINLDDDYIKFVRYGEYFIEKNGEGILAYISNNSFIDGITHRQMRKHLLETFDKIYILDLHGNSKKKETSPDGSKDENVFDIQQGVSINIFVKNNKKKKNELGKVFHSDIFGKRDYKYKHLVDSNIDGITKKELACPHPGYYFVPKDFDLKEEYDSSIRVADLFIENNTGIQTKRDKFVYQFSEKELEIVLQDIKSMETELLRKKYDLGNDGRDWSVDWAKKDLNNNSGVVTLVHYHPFDLRETFFTGRSKGFMAYPRSPLMSSMIDENIALLSVRNSRQGNTNNFMVTNTIVDKDGISPFDNCKIFPLYLYPQKDNNAVFDNGREREPNLNMEIVQKIADGLGLKFVKEKVDTEGTFAPIDLLDYIYAVLHSPSYRDKYKEFLKIDFPRIPYPEDAETFWKLVSKGGELRQIHLMESPILENHEYYFPVEGNNEVEKPEYKGGRVYINKDQYFENVPEISWNFYIGGYQPAQKWLKDRKGRVLTFDDIQHYQKITKALLETDRVMKEIDEVGLC